MENKLVGSFCCPICTKDSPHTHSSEKWIGVDFDGTIAYTIHNRTSPYELGEPIPVMVNRVKDWITKGYTVKLLTARMNLKSSTGAERDIEKMRQLLEDWCVKHIGVKLECTNSKDGWMEALWDDRAVQVVEDTGMPIAFELSDLKDNRAIFTKEQIDQMVDRFLSWKLPEHFYPDAGISFMPEYNVEYMARQGRAPMRHEPIGTNLFNTDQARAMIIHMLGDDV